MPESDRRRLVLGGARSGKSAHAEHTALAVTDTARWIYVATARAEDEEMAARIARHRADRDPRWETVEAPTDLAAAIAAHDRPDTLVLVDCLTLWLANVQAAEAERDPVIDASPRWPAERHALLETVAGWQGRLLLVSNEVGSGIVPLGELSRVFVDAAGRLHQDLARCCDRVDLIVAGLPLSLK